MRPTASLCPLYTRLKVTFVALTFAVFSCLQQQLIWSTTLSDCGTPHTTHHDAVDDAITQSSFNLMIEKFTQQQNPPTNIYVLGERNSGTNYAAGVLRKAFNPPNEVDPSRTHEYFSSDIPVLRHKHMLRHSLLNETELAEISKRTDILWVLAVRSPCEWAEAMKRNPWHMCMPNNISAECPGAGFIGFEHKVELREYTLAEFFKMEWGDWPESTNFRNLSFVGDEFIYRNIFHLRRHKLLLMKQIIDAVPRNVKIVRLHELERSPETFIQDLVQEFRVPLKKGYNPQRPSNKIHTQKCLSRRAWEAAQREIDWHTESSFGYTFLDCHRCYS